MREGCDGEMVQLVRPPGESPRDERGLQDGEPEQDTVDVLGSVSCGGILTLGQSVDAVVHDQVRERRIAAEGVDEVAHPDRVAVPVAAGGDDRQVWIRHPCSGGGGQDPAVERVVSVGAEVVLHRAAAPDAGENEDFLSGHADVAERTREGGLDAEMAATGAPDRHGGEVGVGHCLPPSPSRILAASSPGEKGMPSYLSTLISAPIGAPAEAMSCVSWAS